MKSILNELTRQEAKPMLSIIVSTELKSFPEKGKLKLKLKNGIKTAAKELKLNYDEETARKLINSTKSLVEKIDLDHVENGIGIYVAPGFEKLISFPFEVEEKVVVSSSFEVSDIEKTIDKMVDYAVITVSKQMVRLCKGVGNKFKEVEDINFPFYFEDQFQVHRTAPHSLYNMEESEVDQARLDNYYRKIDQLLTPYLKGNPLILMGPIEALSDFREARKSSPHILAELTGNFDKFKSHEIFQKIWPEIERYINGKKKPSIVS